MRSSLVPPAVALLFALTACGGRERGQRLLPTVAGTIEIEGLTAPVRITRDRWGVPHVYAESRDDLFTAQGFVQAEDRLFQMDLWRRAAQGRLSEVLGANFIERDAMTRRLQYHGDPEADWAAHGADTRAIARAFINGVNAWVAIAREQTPELFRLAGWTPEEWNESDLLNRTDGFDRAGSVAVAEQQRLPPTVVDVVRRAAVPPFFTGLAQRPLSSGSAVHGSVGPAPDANTDALPIPSPYYFIHLHVPKWNAIGATRPWRPGIAVGHDGAAAWKRPEASFRAAVRVETLDSTAGRVIKDSIAVKGRAEPFAYETRVTANGVVIATDREQRTQFVLDWEGFAEGTAPAFGSAITGAAESDRSAPAPPQEPTRPRVLFVHPLAISPAARDRLNVGPLNRPAASDAIFRVMWDSRAWDASRAMNAPGQAEWPASVHYSDLAGLWASGETFPLVYTDGAVSANAEAILTLVPRRRR